MRRCGFAYATLFTLCGLASAEDAPIEKVVQLLEDLQTQILTEGKAEATTYDKFACFCKDMTEDKTAFIQEGTDGSLELEAEIGGMLTRRKVLDKQISEVSNIIAEKDKGLEEAKAQREKDHEEFRRAEDDCFTFKKELDWAVVELMAAEEGIDTSGMSKGSFVTLKAMVEKARFKGPNGIRQALVELKRLHPVDGLSPAHRKLAKELLQMDLVGSMSQEPESHTGSIVKNIKELKPGMEDTLKRLRADEVQSKHLYQMVQQGLMDEKKAQERILDEARKNQAENSKNVASNQQDLTLTMATLKDDQAYLKDLTDKCNVKSKQWDQRSQARASELTAITSALTMLKQNVATKVSDKTVRLLNTAKNPVSQRTVMGELQEESDDSNDDVLSLADAEADVSLLQRSVSPHHWYQVNKERPTFGLRDMVRHQNSARFLKKEKAEFATEDHHPLQQQLDKELAESAKREAEQDRIFQREQKEAAALSNPVEDDGKPELDMKQDREKAAQVNVVTLLRSRSRSLKSAKLSALAAAVSKSPFDKITKLVQELIERLHQEAADEANHEGWCKKSLTLAKEQRDRKAKTVHQLNDVLANSEAKRDKLSEEIEDLGGEISELEDQLSKMTKERADESAENEATIKEAQEGQQGVEEALDLLTKFYKTAAKNEVEFMQISEDPKLPDAGFDGAYQGSQAASKGVIGMLEVILSDFKRSIASTDAAEKQAAKDFLEFETQSKMSIKTKTNIKNAKDTQLVNLKATVSEDNESMVQEQKLLDKALQELMELQPACMPKQDTYAQRVAKREEEIASLKTALCTLDEAGPTQTESADCS